jgi:glycosyltransferase involved in cell wall biosynthesis
VPHYLWSDVCLAPSVFVRGIPDPKVLVVNAAMGCGRAVIAVTAVGSAYSMIKSGTNGFVVPGV